MLPALLFFAVGLALLAAGAEALVRGAAGLAVRLSLPPAVVAALVIGFGTSLPELVASVQASLAASPGIAVGNVAGSSIANIFAVLGLVLVLAPMERRAELRTSVLALLPATLLFALLVLFGHIGRGRGP